MIEPPKIRTTMFSACVPTPYWIKAARHQMRRSPNTHPIPNSDSALYLECWSSSAPPTVNNNFATAIGALPNLPPSHLPPADTVEVIEAVLTAFSGQLVSRIYGIWETRKQTEFLEAAAALPSGHPALARYFHRKNKPYQPRSISKPAVFYGVRLDHVLGVFIPPGRRRGSKLLRSRMTSRGSKPGRK